MAKHTQTHTRIAIVGSGFSGLGAAVRLKRDGFSDFLVFERADDIGGTWRDNTYPGCACDVESHLYSFSFAPNPAWSRSFSEQPEILAYLKRCAQEFELASHFRLSHELLDARWDEAQQHWVLRTSKGEYTANVLVSGMGALSEPSLPSLPGLERFQGKTFHSAQWDHQHDLTGKQVAVVGTGASAIQFVPAIQPKVKKLTLFQRTPAWVIPRLDRAITGLEKRAYASSARLHKLLRASIYARRELFVVGFRNPTVMRAVEFVAKRYLAASVSDRKLRDKLTPNFRIGCKRILISNDYLPALTKPNVDVVTTGIREVREHSVVTTDGVEHPVDTIIFGTGFHVSDMPFADRVRGRSGRTLNQTWNGSPEAHLGTTVAGFPNLFLLLGPNTGLGHTSVVLMIEAQLDVMMDALKHLRSQRLETLETKPEAQAQFVGEIDRGMRGTVWTDGHCASWYQDPTGRISSLWPSYTFAFMRRARFRLGDYVFAGKAADVRSASPANV